MVFKLEVSYVVFTNSTDVISFNSLSGDWHGQGQRALAAGISRWTVVGGLASP